MKALLTFLSFVLFCILIQAKPADVQLSKEEEECISQTGIDKKVVFQDKMPDARRSSPINPVFNAYLGCYRNKLLKGRKISEMRKMYVPIPGYKTPFKIQSLLCDENGSHVLGIHHPCIEKQPTYLALNVKT